MFISSATVKYSEKNVSNILVNPIKPGELQQINLLKGTDSNFYHQSA